jgi:hypothetical protein
MISYPIPDPRLVAHLRAATELHVYRLDPAKGSLAALEIGGVCLPDRLLGTPIVYEVPVPGEGWRDSLVTLLAKPSSYAIDHHWLLPDIGFRFHGPRACVDVVLHLGAQEIHVMASDSLAMSGSFEAEAQNYLRLAAVAFPADSSVQAWAHHVHSGVMTR